MNLAQLLETLGFEPDLLLTTHTTQEQEDLLFETEIEVHQQMTYPLKGSLANVRLLNGKLALASGTASEYGDGEAWEEPEWEV